MEKQPSKRSHRPLRLRLAKYLVGEQSTGPHLWDMESMVGDSDESVGNTGDWDDSNQEEHKSKLTCDPELEGGPDQES